MKYFRDLLLRKTPEFFTNAKFRRKPLPFVLPLKKRTLSPVVESAKKWKIQMVNEGGVYEAHLILPKNNRVQPKNDVAQNRRTVLFVPIEKTEHAFHCESLDHRSAIQHFIITLHPNAVVTMMAIPREGNRLKLCQMLCGTDELPDVEKMHDAELVNQFSFQYTPKAGADPRARASLAIQCDNAADIERLESFISAIQLLAPFDETMMCITNQIVARSKTLTEITKRFTQLEAESHELGIPVVLEDKYISYKPKIAEHRSAIKEEKEQLLERSKWNIAHSLGAAKNLNIFAGFPNGIPDNLNHMRVLTYAHDVIYQDMNRIPKIHLAILDRDRAQLLKIIAENPASIYTRDPQGLLPIELACQTTQPELSWEIFSFWTTCPMTQQWATHIFQSTANAFFYQEFHHYHIDEENFREDVKNYFSAQLPNIDNPLAIYHAIEQNNQSGLSQLCQREIAPWAQLLALCQTQDLPQIKQQVAALLGDKYALISAILKGNRDNILAAANDCIPDLPKLDGALHNGRYQKLSEQREQWYFQELVGTKDIIETSAEIAVYRKKIRMIISEINLLQNPLTEDHLIFRDKIEELWQLDTMCNEIRAGCEEWRAFCSKHYMSLPRYRERAVIALLESLKADITSDFNLSALSERLHTKINKLKEKHQIPHVSLILALLKNNLSEATHIIQGNFQQKGQAIAPLTSVDTAKKYFDRKQDHRSAIHQAVLENRSLPIADFIAEKNQFEQFKKAIYELYHQECIEFALLEKEIDYAKDISLLRMLTGDNPLIESMKVYLDYFIKQVVIYPEKLTELLNKFEEDLLEIITDDATKDLFRSYFMQIFTIKSKTQPKLQRLIQEYQQHSKCQDNEIFTVFTLLLAQRQGAQAYFDELKIPKDIWVDSIITAKAQAFAETKTGVAKSVLKKIFNHGPQWADAPRFMDNMIASALLSYQQQDAWGYTPLLLAVAANRLDVVKAFFDNDLALDWIVTFNKNPLLYYTLLSHAHSREMLALVLHYYTSPDSRFTFLQDKERSLDILLHYNHNQKHPLDTHGLELLDFVAAGHPIPLDSVNELLKHRKHFVQEGPYDPTVPKTVQDAFTKHNLERDKALNRVRARMLPLIASESFIRLAYQNERYFSEFKTTAQLNRDEHRSLSQLFSACFELPNVQDSNEKTQQFFSEKVLTNSNYLYELFYSENNSRPVGFFCFQVKAMTDQKFGLFLCAHLSIAACAPDYAQKGLLSSSMKIVLALEKYAKAKKIPLKCYSRFVRPGVAYALLPEHIDMSTKYHRPDGFVNFVAEQFNNKIELNGSSLPPVRSKTIVNSRTNSRLDAYRFFIDECLDADQEAALPLVIDIKDAFVTELTEELTLSTDITAAHLEFIYQQLNALLESMNFDPNNAAGTQRAKL